MFDLSSQYAIRAVLHLARLEPGTLVQAHVLAKELDLPAPYLSKILQQLVKDGLTVSRKGPSGGFALAKPSAEIRVFDVVNAFQDLGHGSTRSLGHDEALEPLEEFIRGWRASFVQTLRGLTVAQLIDHADKRRAQRLETERAAPVQAEPIAARDSA